MAQKPNVTVLCAPGAGPWPGLEPLEQSASVAHVSDGDVLAQSIVDADVLVVTDFRTTRLRDIWPQAKRVKWVHATSAGVDMLLFPELLESDVVVTNARGIFDNAIAEYVLGLILCFAKDFPGTLRQQAQGQWNHRDNERVAERSVLIVGAGSIGRSIARLLSTADMQVSGVGRSARADDPDFRAVYGSSDLPRVIADADYVVIAAPLTPETSGMFDRDMFQRMKTESRLINIGRGPIVDTEALIDALENGEIAGAALDVFEQEPLPQDHPLWRMPQAIVSPHMAGDFIGWREAVSAQFLENFQRWREGQELLNVVDKHRGYVPAG